jgi:hypothetical protein
MVIESRRIRCAGHVVCMRKMRRTKFWLKNLTGGNYSEDKHSWQDVKTDLMETVFGVSTGFIWLRKGTSGKHL